MGADGGIVGIKLKGEALTSRDAMRELVEAVPEELRYWDDYDHCPYREAEELPGYWYSTYGTGQDWDLGDLIEMVEEAREYLKVQPEATFESWCEDIYTNPLSENPGWLSLPDGTVTGWGRMSAFLAERYLGWVYYSRARCLSAPCVRWPQADNFYTRGVAEWISVIEKHVDLAAGVDREETWT